MVEILRNQRTRILNHQKELESPQQMLPFAADERRQVEADKRHWARRLRLIEKEIKEEPDRIRGSYEIRATRVEPVGLVYLWPVSG